VERQESQGRATLTIQGPVIYHVIRGNVKKTTRLKNVLLVNVPLTLLFGPNLAKGQILANVHVVTPHRRCSLVQS
jgi:hypothetical protein